MNPKYLNAQDQAVFESFPEELARRLREAAPFTLRTTSGSLQSLQSLSSPCQCPRVTSLTCSSDSPSLSTISLILSPPLISFSWAPIYKFSDEYPPGVNKPMDQSTDLRQGADDRMAAFPNAQPEYSDDERPPTDKKSGPQLWSSVRVRVANHLSGKQDVQQESKDCK